MSRIKILSNANVLHTHIQDFDIEYKVFDHILVLFGKRKHHSNTSSPEKGRRYQAFVRPILLSPDMNSDKIVKEVENGITHIKVPKNGTFKKLLVSYN